jgi:hypothetical protein
LSVSTRRRAEYCAISTLTVLTARADFLYGYFHTVFSLVGAIPLALTIWLYDIDVFTAILSSAEKALLGIILPTLPTSLKSCLLQQSL